MAVGKEGRIDKKILRMESVSDCFVGGDVLIEQYMLVFHYDSDCHPFIHYFLKCEIKHNFIYIKEIGIENVKCFHDFFFCSSRFK